jgi:hypothetical protein
MTTLLVVEPPSHAVERCELCKNEKGKGAVIVNGGAVPCVCATPEWANKINRSEQERRKKLERKAQASQTGALAERTS